MALGAASGIPVHRSRGGLSRSTDRPEPLPSGATTAQKCSVGIGLQVGTKTPTCHSPQVALVQGSVHPNKYRIELVALSRESQTRDLIKIKFAPVFSEMLEKGMAWEGLGKGGARKG